MFATQKSPNRNRTAIEDQGGVPLGIIVQRTSLSSLSDSTEDEEEEEEDIASPSFHLDLEALKMNSLAYSIKQLSTTSEPKF